MLADRYAVADVDGNIIEPRDLWSSRMASEWEDLVPHVAFDDPLNECWFVGDRREVIEASPGDLPDESAVTILQYKATRLYCLDAPRYATAATA